VIHQPMWKIGGMITVCVGQLYIVQTTYVKNNVTWTWPVGTPSPSSKLNIHTLLDIKQIYTLLGCLALQASWPLSLVTTCVYLHYFHFPAFSKFFFLTFIYFKHHIVKTVFGKGLLHNINISNDLSLIISSYMKQWKNINC
jgi:hypothetical protein